MGDKEERFITMVRLYITVGAVEAVDVGYLH